LGSTLSGTDSTSNAITLTNAGGAATAGKIDGAGSFSGSSGVQMNTGNNPYSSATFSGSGLTLETWVNSGFVPVLGQIISMEGAYVLDLNVLSGTARLGFEIDGSGGDIYSTTPVSMGIWYHLVATSDASGNLKTYVNGVPDTTGSQTFYNLDSLSRAYSVAGHPTLNINFPGIIDEARISNVARSADWILAEYNNQGNPCTFYTPHGTGCTTPSPATQIGGFLVGP
jgi:trimeric autotransporter adhesin